jgi:hypothetical protein
LELSSKRALSVTDYIPVEPATSNGTELCYDIEIKVKPAANSVGCLILAVI